MADGGWIKIYRSIRSHWLWENGHERYAKWWIDILMMVNHKPKKIPFNGKLKLIDRGEKQTSVVKLASRWNVDRRTVTKFLDLLVSDQMILVSKSRQTGTTLKVLNYNDYQDNNTDGEHQNVQRTTQRNAHKQEPKELKNINYVEFINWFNQQTGKKFKDVESNRKLIRARLNEGFSKSDLVLVVKFKSQEWKDNTEMNKYLRLNTLFAPSHFNDYLNEANDANQQSISNSEIKPINPDELDKQEQENNRLAAEQYMREHSHE